MDFRIPNHLNSVNKSRYIRDLRRQADKDYCLARLLHYGFYFVFAAKYYFQQSIEKYLKAMILLKSVSDLKNVDDFEKFLKGRYFGHKLHVLWGKSGELYPNMNILFDKQLSIFLKKEFDDQSVSERSRYPQKEFGCHPVGFVEGYISTVDRVVYELCGIGQKRRINPMETTIKECNLWRISFSGIDKNSSKVSNHDLLERCFYCENNFFTKNR